MGLSIFVQSNVLEVVGGFSLPLADHKSALRILPRPSI
jgi:hypothetical protein